MRDLASFDELGRSVGRPLSILVEDEPMTRRCIYGKLDVAAHLDLGFIQIDGTFGVALHVRLALGDEPALEVVRAVDVVEGHVDGVGIIGARLVAGVVQDLVRTERHIHIVAIIRNGVRLEEHGVIGDDFVFGDARFELRLHLVAYVLDGERLVLIGRRVVRVGRPAVEVHALIESARTRVVDNVGEGLLIAVGKVGLLDLHGGHFVIAAHELHVQARSVGDRARRNDGINGKLGGSELGLVVDERVNVNGVGCAFVVDVDDADVFGIVVGGLGNVVGVQRNLDLGSWLDFFAVLVAEGDVDGFHLLHLTADSAFDGTHDGG